MKTLVHSFFLMLIFLYPLNTTNAIVQINRFETCATGCGEYLITATGIWDEFQRYSGDYLVFWHFGDGNYLQKNYIINDASPITINYQYSRTGDHDVYLEVVPRYERGKPPKRFQYPNNNNPMLFHSDCSSSCNPLPSAPTRVFSHSSNRDFVPEHQVSYLLSYANLCDAEPELSNMVDGSVSFEYDSKEIDLDPTLPPVYDRFSIPASHKTVQNGSKFTLTWEFEALKINEIKNIIIPLVVDKSVRVGQDVIVTASIKIDSAGPCEYIETVPIKTTVANSHDPNSLKADQDFTCDLDQVNVVKYVIRFQNDGDGPATTVLIKDLIPEYFDLSTIETIYPFDPFATLPADKVPAHSIITSTREVRWNLENQFLKNGTKLKGTAQAGFGQSIFLEDCVDSLVFRITKKSTAKLNKCDAIINRAEIIFDCNPSFYTDPYIFRFGCLDTTFVVINPNDTSQNSVSLSTGPVPPMIDTITCNNCKEKGIIESNAGIYQNGNAVQLLIDQSYLPEEEGRTFQWYPSAGLDNTKVMQPMASPIKATDYYLIASNPLTCERTIYKVRVDIPCKLRIKSKIYCNSLNNGNGNKSLTLTTNSTSPHLVWQDCTMPGNIYSTTTGNRYFYASVVDTLTGCYATANVKMICPLPVPVWPKQNVLFVGGIILICLLLAFYFFRKP